MEPLANLSVYKSLNSLVTCVFLTTPTIYCIVSLIVTASLSFLYMFLFFIHYVMDLPGSEIKFELKLNH